MFFAVSEIAVLRLDGDVLSIPLILAKHNRERRPNKSEKTAQSLRGYETVAKAPLSRLNTFFAYHRFHGLEIMATTCADTKPGHFSNLSSSTAATGTP